jgi:hypothetical protein
VSLALLEKKKFILIVGDDGAILTLVDKTKVEKRLFALSASLTDRREFNALITKYPNVPIYLLLDTMEQSYTKQTLPAVGSLAIGKLVKKRLDRDFAASDIKGALLVGKDDSGRRDWIYMFASAPVTPAIAEWIEYVASLENKFTGIYMLPIEMENFVKKFQKAAFPDRKDHPSWHFLLTSNKTGGFRQVILQNDKVIFTRLIRPGKDVVPDIVAGNIEQEILNTIDYMRRLGFGEEDTMQITAIVSAELKRSLTNTKIRGKEISLFTPVEAATTLGMKDIIGNEDKFSDIVLATSFANSSAILKLEDPRMQMANLFISVSTFSTVGMVAIVPIFMIYIGYMVFHIISVSSDIKKVEDDKANIERKWKDARKTDQYSIEDSNKIANVMTLHKKLSAIVSPLDIIAKACVNQRSYALAKSISWNYDRTVAATPGQEPPKQQEKAIFNLEFSSKGQSPEELFRNFDTFRSNLTKDLTGYKVEISELPGTITFDDKTNIIPVQVKADGVDNPNQGAATPPSPAQ